MLLKPYKNLSQVYQMKYIEVTNSNIDDLFELNRELAIAEEQENLFVAEKDAYKSGFLSESPVVYGVLIYKNNDLIGFGIYLYKFATYLGKKILHLEDVYLKENYKRAENINDLLEYFIRLTKQNDCCRLELRVLHKLNIGIPELREVGFNKITKWDVYRLEI